MAGQVTPDDNAPFPGSLPRMSILVLKHSDTVRLTLGSAAFPERDTGNIQLGGFTLISERIFKIARADVTDSCNLHL